MADNLSKKFALLCCSMMTMQALRLVISTAGFCVVRFHIECSLFNIFISRLVNAVMMSQLFGNWLGDLIVFAADGRWKLIGNAMASWAEFICFCAALICICHTESGHLTGFYWSMVWAYFWWKASEAPAVSIAAFEADYYFAGFTLSGVWAAILKGLVMRCVTDDANTIHFHSDALGDVNVSVVGARSVKTTVDYRAAKWLYILTLVLTALMCLAWSVVAAAVDGWDRQKVIEALKKLTGGNTAAQTAIRQLAQNVSWKAGTDNTKTLNFGSAEVGAADVVATDGKTGEIVIKVTGVKKGATNWSEEDQAEDLEEPTKDDPGKKTVREKIAELAKTALQATVTGASWDVGSVDASVAAGSKAGEIKLTLTSKGAIDGTSSNAWKNYTVMALAGTAFGGVLAVPGALLGVGILQVWEWFSKKPASKWTLIVWTIVGALGGMAAGVGGTVIVDAAKGTARVAWVNSDKWAAHPRTDLTTWAAMIGLGTGLVTGALMGLCIGAAEDSYISDLPNRLHKLENAVGMAVRERARLIDNVDVVAAAKSALRLKRLEKMVGMTASERAEVIETVKAAYEHSLANPTSYKLRGTAAGAFFGSFLGRWTGEIVNGAKTATMAKAGVVVCGFLINVLALGTVYSIYPGMAPCSITQFQYFNIIDILILILSSIAPIVIMGLDLVGDATYKLADTIGKAFDTAGAGTAWMVIGLLLLIATNVCEILVLSIMQHPHSKLAQQVTTSGWRAVTLTVTMVTSQLTSASVGFGSVVAGGGFNDGIANVHSTLVLWTIECTGVLGEGYLTELKKYEPGKWPTQGLGKWESHKWWRNKIFGNAWQIWCCIGTTDLRRDIMLCRQ